MKIVSIVTVTFNVSDCIIPTLESVKKIKTPDIEYIVIDGGSTDNTLTVLDLYSDIIDIKISEHDNGIYDAMNKGVKFASGRFIININAGDEILYVPIQTLLSLNKDYCGVCGIVLDQYGNQVIPRFDHMMRFGNQIPHQGMFYRKVDTPLYDLQFSIFADYDLNLKLYRQGRKIFFLDNIVALHSLNGVSMNRKYEKERMKILRKHFGIFGPINLWLYYRYDGFTKRLKNLWIK